MFSNFDDHQKALKRLTETLNLSRNPLIDIVKQLQSSQEIIRSIPQIDFSSIAGTGSLFANFANDFNHPLQEMVKVITASQNQYFKNLGQISSISQMFAKQILEQQVNFNKIHANLMQDVLSLAPHINEITTSLPTVLDSIRLTELATFSSLSNSPAFSQLSRNLFQSIQMPQLMDFSGGFLEDVSSLLHDIAENETSQLNNDVVSEFDRLFANHVRELKKGRISREGIVQIIRDLALILTLIFSWLALQSSYDSGRTLEETQQVVININEQLNEQLQHLQKLEQNTDSLEPELKSLSEETILSNQHLESLVELGERLVPYAEQVNDLDEDAIILVTKYTTPLRSEPSRKGAIIIRIYPNQLVEQLKRERGLVYVEFFDFTEGIPKTGWVYRRNLVLWRE